MGRTLPTVGVGVKEMQKGKETARRKKEIIKKAKKKPVGEIQWLTGQIGTGTNCPYILRPSTKHSRAC
jgi:hypothetical protein